MTISISFHRIPLGIGRLGKQWSNANAQRELLAPVYGWFTEGFGTRDLKEAKALLKELEA
jgi:predicted ATPase